jgi:DNA-binding transcriptional ArsR family regulator
LEGSEVILSKTKLEVLEELLLQDEFVKAVQIAKDLKKDSRAVQMHLIGLVKMGYAEAPKKGQYAISENGKRVLGIPEVSKEKELLILAKNPQENAFHFYATIGKPLSLSSCDLQDFCDKISKVCAESIEFHFNRGDFEAWFKFLGDHELCKKMELLKKKKLVGDELRAKIQLAAVNRCLLLAKRLG